MKMLHVRIQTKYFQEEMDFFLKHVGLTIERDMRPFGRNMVFLSNAVGETCIEIIENDKEDAGNPNLSVGFLTENLEKKREELITDGYEPTPIINPAQNVMFFFVKDPAGVNIQFM